MLKRLAPWLAALIVLLAAWFVRLPDPVLSLDQLVAQRMPETRGAVERTRPAFLDAQQTYLDYVKSHNMASLLADIKAQLAAIKAQKDQAANQAAFSSLQSYLEQLERYTSSGQSYFDVLKQYDDDLMAWTRSLGAVSESLRDDTFPIVEHVKLYPLPFGETADPPYISASQVTTQVTTFNANLLKLQQMSSSDEQREVADAVSKDVDNIWAMGRSIEHMEALHEQYYTFLKTYDSAVQATIAQGDTAQAPSPLALTLNALVGVLALGGIGALFVSRANRPQPGQL
jgi:small-conductance mechanosensitive channel